MMFNKAMGQYPGLPNPSAMTPNLSSQPNLSGPVAAMAPPTQPQQQGPQTPGQMSLGKFNAGDLLAQMLGVPGIGMSTKIGQKQAEDAKSGGTTMSFSNGKMSMSFDLDKFASFMGGLMNKGSSQPEQLPPMEQAQSSAAAPRGAVENNFPTYA